MLLPEDFPWGWDSGVGKLCDVAILTRLQEKTEHQYVGRNVFDVGDEFHFLFQSPVPEGQCTMKVV